MHESFFLSPVCSPTSKKRRTDKGPAGNQCEHLCCDKIFKKLRELVENQIIIKNELRILQENMRESSKATPQLAGIPKRGEKVAETVLADQIAARINAKRGSKKVSSCMKLKFFV